MASIEFNWCAYFGVRINGNVFLANLNFDTLLLVDLSPLLNCWIKLKYFKSLPYMRLKWVFFLMWCQFTIEDSPSLRVLSWGWESDIYIFWISIFSWTTSLIMIINNKIILAPTHRTVGHRIHLSKT